MILFGQKKTLLDLSSRGIKDDMLNLLEEASKSANIRIKTPVGITEAKTLIKLIMQGETMSSILCSSTIGKISDDSEIENYKYRDEVDIPSLGFVDDVVDIKK